VRAHSPTLRRHLRTLLLALLCGVLATWATAWGPDLVRGIREARTPRSSGQWLQKAQQFRITNEQRVVLGRLRYSFWTDHCSLGFISYAMNVSPTRTGGIDSTGFQLTSKPVVAAPTDPVRSAPYWAAKPPGRLADATFPVNDVVASTMASGLPWRCVRSYAFISRANGKLGVDARGGWGPSRSSIFVGGFPIDPIWPGLVGDVLFWSALAWVLLVSAGALRRWRRRRRGQCAQCGYDAAGLPVGAVCPECGAGAAG